MAIKKKNRGQITIVSNISEYCDLTPVFVKGMHVRGKSGRLDQFIGGDTAA